MTASELEETVVVFDLDDTLYREDDYNKSGIAAVCADLGRLYGKNIEDELLAARVAKADIWERACHLLSLPLAVKESLLWLYRLHCPSIRLDEAVMDMLLYIKKYARHVAVLTDGRAISQRQKLMALGLLDFSVYISEEYNSEKPDLKRFEQIMSDYPAEHYVYVGDNPKKDFIAPNALGWQTFGLKGRVNNIHPQEVEGLPSLNLPQIWIDELSDVTKYLSSADAYSVK